ncbi:MAG: hypothetical protein HQ583_02085, partial [Candidatus Abyssubacteria bacterium]|nr:hypothetical protein [Candidatus Abyssubacteria bacterium]
MKSTKIPDNIWLSASILVFVAGVASSGYQLMKFLKTPIPAKLSYIADDAFYYLNVCLNKANLDMWTFDGINPTTGFHLLHAFILVQVIKAFGLFGDNLVIGAVLICFLSFCTSCIIVFLISKKLLDKTYAFLFSGIWMGTLYNIRGALTGMEFGLVLLMTTLFFYMLVELLDSISSDHNKIQHIMKFVSIFFLSFLLCLTRTDLVFLGIASSFALLFSSLFLEPKGSPRALFLRNTGLIIFAGTALSMFTITAFCHAVTGKLIQDSGRIKRIWEHLDATSNMTS